MPTTRTFKSGNSQAVRIPAEIAYDEIGKELTITRMGDVLTIFPAKRSLKEAVRRLREMPKPPAVSEREPIDLPDREGA
jgi:antitoxin VapB